MDSLCISEGGSFRTVSTGKRLVIDSLAEIQACQKFMPIAFESFNNYIVTLLTNQKRRNF
jgi:hypothetical protein